MVPRTVLKLFSRPQMNNLKNTISYFTSYYISCNKLNANVCSIYTTTNPLAVPKISTEKSSKSKATIISSLNFRCAKDAEPFYELPITILYQIQKTTLNDVRNGFCENRLYYISSRIQCPPEVLSKRLANRSFVYKLTFSWLESSLNELIEKGVLGDRILQDLWVLKYHHKTISERLQRIKDMGIANLFPWMVRCTPEILNRYLEIDHETKIILGDSKSTQMYLANRLNISVDDIELMCVKIPALKTIRASKVKHFVDFLTNEGFHIEEIAKKPRILASSQKTIRQRLEKLRQLGVQDINLNVLCRSNKDFKKICESLEAGSKHSTSQIRECKKPC